MRAESRRLPRRVAPPVRAPVASGEAEADNGRPVPDIPMGVRLEEEGTMREHPWSRLLGVGVLCASVGRIPSPLVLSQSVATTREDRQRVTLTIYSNDVGLVREVRRSQRAIQA